VEGWRAVKLPSSTKPAGDRMYSEGVGVMSKLSMKYTGQNLMLGKEQAPDILS
jgi:hypothetical protein